MKIIASVSRRCLLVAGFLLFAGCVENTPSKTSADAACPASPHAECLVCKHNADLACVDIKIEKDTPRATIAGKEYFFCSDECRKECLAHPEKFVGEK
jgi:YHS domain-containing protein